jgi:hypothetical protein
MAGPQQFSTNDGSLAGGVNGGNVVFTSAPVLPAVSSLVFLNGQMLTQPGQAVSVSNVTTLHTAPIAGNFVTVEAWSPDTGANPIPLNAPTQYSTADGSLQGLVNAQNGVFSLNTSALVTAMLLFWNGNLMVTGTHYTFNCAWVGPGDAMVTTITMIAGNYPRAGDTLTAEVFFA